MAGKPTSIAAILQEGLPKKAPTSGIPTRNRFSVLKDRSCSVASGRSDFRSDSQKRIRVESPERVDRHQAFKSMADEEEKFKIAKSLVEKVKEGVKAAKDKGMEGPIWAILQNISEWMDVTTGVQETTANVVVDSFNKVASPPRKSRRDSPGRRGQPVLSEQEAAIVAKKKKFGQEVREAEKSTLIFRTHMGTTPIMNPETMKRKFTENVIAKAAAVEMREDGRPSPAVADQLDDALAMVTKMEFFGKQTKKSKNRLGEEDDFCTIPVKLVFKDKETREAADGRMRKLCKMGGTIPYHRTLRNVINITLDEAKKKYPRSFIQVKVDVENFQLKISRLEDGSWMNNVELVDLPESVLDLSRTGPIVRRKRILSSQHMDTEADNEADQGEGEQAQG
jgi:hypothetical protein